MIERALISVYEKNGIADFGKSLIELGIEVVASGGTRTVLSDEGLEVTEVSDLTEMPELMGGRVKTLHPYIHAGILARRGHDEDISALDEHGIRPFDLVCVNLYPFSDVIAQSDTSEGDAIEMIDIGGPAMLRAAAKNFLHVVPVCSPDQYEFVLNELRLKGNISIETRRELAAVAFTYTADYEAKIANWFVTGDLLPEKLLVSFEKDVDLSYGENPHQRAAYYVEDDAQRHLLSCVRQLGGKSLSFNNLNDLNAARRIAADLSDPSCVIVKHANPCGVASGRVVDEAYAGALASDPVSAFGGVVVLNRPIERDLALVIANQFIEVILAPDFSDEAVEILSSRENMRILASSDSYFSASDNRDFRRVLGAMLVQEADSGGAECEDMKVATKSKPSQAQWDDLLFAWSVVKHVASNAIVIVKDRMTIGIGGGQMSRVDAVRIAIEKAREHGHDLDGSVLASDAFFPFSDGPAIALEEGVVAIIQPGGSKRDLEVIEEVEGRGAKMVFTGIRHFRH